MQLRHHPNRTARKIPELLRTLSGKKSHPRRQTLQNHVFWGTRDLPEDITHVWGLIMLGQRTQLCIRPKPATFPCVCSSVPVSRTYSALEESKESPASELPFGTRGTVVAAPNGGEN